MSDELEERIEDAINHTGPQEWDPLNIVSASVVMGGRDADDARVVGALLNLDGDRVIGTIPNTPAGELGVRRVAAIMGLPVDWAVVERIEANNSALQWMRLGVEPIAVDGRWRIIALALNHTINVLAVERGQQAAVNWFDTALDRIQSKVRSTEAAEREAEGEA